MSFLKSLLILVLNLHLIFAPAFAQAAQNKVTAAQKKAWNERAVRALFDHLVSQSAIVESAQDYEKYMLVGLKDSDRKALAASLSGQKEWPTYQRVGDALVVDNGIKRFELKILNIAKYNFEINGVRWTYDPAQALVPQLEAMQNLVTGKKHAGLFQLLPEADAYAWVVAILVGVTGAVVGAIGSESAKETWCVWDPQEWALCAELRTKAEEAQFKDAPSLDAVSNQNGSDNKNILAAYESQDWNCPTNNDGKDREYRGRLRKVEAKDGKTKPTSDWFNVVAKFNPAGFPTDLIITRENVDPARIDSTSKKAVEDLVIHIAFDPTKKKPISYRMPNPKYNPSRDLLGSPTVTLSPTLKLTPEQKDSIAKAKDIVKYINYRNYNCVAKQVEREQKEGVVSGSPGASTTPTEPTTGAAPAIIQ